MANISVYPYGQNENLPSGYPIADDLNTNSAQQALSAKQGKLIGDYLFPDIYDEVNLQSLELRDYSLGNGNPRNWINIGKHKAIPVTPGKTVKIHFYSTEVGGGFYGLFTDQYVQPTAESSPAPYVSGGRVWIGISDADFNTLGYSDVTVNISIPSGAAYLIICPKDGNQLNSTWGVSIKEEHAESINDDFIQRNQIVNNLYSGGETVPLSAEMGKTLANNICTILFENGGSANWQTGNVSASGISSYANKYLILESPGDSNSVFIKKGSSSYTLNIFGSTNLTSFTLLSVINQSGGTVEVDTEGYVYIVLSLWDKPSTESAIDESLTVYYIPVNSPNTIFPPDIVRHAYIGAKVSVTEEHNVGTKKVATVTSQNFQGGACFGNYLFMFTENNTTCWIYNLSTNTLLQTYTIPSAERGFVSNCHCNTVNFGTEYYDSNDSFPLIYVSTGYASGGYSGVLVYRILTTTENDVTTYSLSLVQTVKIPDTWSEFIIGRDGDCYIKTESTGILYYRMKMPKLSQGDITLDFSDALSIYRFTAQPSWYNGSRNQGHIYHNGKIYLVSGVPTSEASLFIVLDLATCRREVEIDLYNTLGLTSEPEAVFFWNGKICVAFRSNTGIYALYFE